MTRIVGATQTYMRSRFNRNGEALVVQVIQELHATKGWRLLSTRKGKTDDRRTPRFHQEYVARPSKKKPRADFPITEKVLMRHGWYRRQQRMEKINAQQTLPDHGAD